MIVKIYTNNSEKIALSKNLTELMTVSGVLREMTSIQNPTIILNRNITDLINCNYVFIEDFNRYYYVNNITSVKQNLTQLDLSCDVLMSFKDDILKQTAIIKKQQDNWNLYIDDGSFSAQQNSRVQIKSFPNSIEGESYVLVLAGTT
jgi:hypothetical protein